MRTLLKMGKFIYTIVQVVLTRAMQRQTFHATYSGLWISGKNLGRNTITQPLNIMISGFSIALRCCIFYRIGERTDACYIINNCVYKKNLIIAEFGNVFDEQWSSIHVVGYALSKCNRWSESQDYGHVTCACVRFTFFFLSPSYIWI